MALGERHWLCQNQTFLILITSPFLSLGLKAFLCQVTLRKLWEGESHLYKSLWLDILCHLSLDSCLHEALPCTHTQKASLMTVTHPHAHRFQIKES